MARKAEAQTTMVITRRKLLASAISLIHPRIVFGQSNREKLFKSLQLVLTDFHPSIPLAPFHELLETFVRSNVAVGCALDSQAEWPEPVLPELSVYLRKVLENYPAQIEFIVQSRRLSSLSDHEQARSATIARSSIETGLSINNSYGRIEGPLKTIANYSDEMGERISAVRAAGFRTVLTLPETDEIRSGSNWFEGVLHLYGGFRLDPSSPIPAVLRRLERYVDSGERATIAFSLADFRPTAVSQTLEMGVALAAKLFEMAQDAKIVTSTPSDYHVRVAEDPRRYVGVRLEISGGPDEEQSEAARHLAASLRELNIPYSVLVSDPTAWLGVEDDICMIAPTNGDVAATWPCLVGPIGDSSAAAPPAKIYFAGRDFQPGLDERAALQPPRVQQLDGFNRGYPDDFAVLDDMVLVLDQRNYSTLLHREIAVEGLKRYRDAPNVDLRDVSGFAEAILPPEILRDRLQFTAEIMFRERSEMDRPPLDRDMLRQDARLSWQYFEDQIDPDTGLCHSVIHVAGTNRFIHPTTTMWDVASHIHALLAAAELGIMDQAELPARLTLLIGSLPTVEVLGLRLPSAEFTVSDPSDNERAFDVCDTGRLLGALNRVRNVLPDLAAVVEDKVAGWDLAGVVDKRRLHDIRKTRKSEHFMTHCAHSAARGFRHFGFEVDSPYRWEGESVADRKMSLLQKVAVIGPFGAEPAMLEALEGGATDQADYLTDVLFAALLDSYRKTGIRRAVSEMVLEREPWFAYLGLNLLNLDDPWTFQSSSNAAKYQTDEFRREMNIISVKTAYLLAILRPHSFTYGLLDYVRERAVVESTGFVSGVYSATGQPTAGYLDLNTNGIILSAIRLALD